jgi:hypothetical protein
MSELKDYLTIDDIDLMYELIQKGTTNKISRKTK